MATKTPGAQRHRSRAGHPLPRLPRVYVPRSRLWQLLDESAEVAVRLLVAPVGAGKTLGVGGWAREARGEDDVRWINGDRSWTPERLTELLDGLPKGRDRRLRTLVVVDDAHLLPAGTIRMVDQRLAADPESLRLLLLSRFDLPLARLVPELLGHLTVLRGDVLRLNDDEARTLVAEHARTDSAEVADSVIRHGQGWSAAIVLTARAVATAADPVAAARAFADGEASIAGRLANDVFAALQPRERHVLLCVAGEERVSAETAAHLSGEADAGEVLAGLEATGLLVSRLPEGWRPASAGSDQHAENAWFRIHPLLSEIVRRRLGKGGVDVKQAQGTIRRAVTVDVVAGHPEIAFERLVATSQPDAAAELLATHGVAMLLHDRGAGIAPFSRRYGDAIESHPGCWFVLALDRMTQQDVDRATHWLDLCSTAAAPSPEEESAVEHAVVRLLRARLGLEPLPQAVELARAVAREHLLRPEPHPAVAVLVGELGSAQAWLGQLADAETNLIHCLALCQSRGYAPLQAAALSHVAVTLHLLGREHASAQAAEEALALALRMTQVPTLVVARAETIRDVSRSCEATSTPQASPARGVLLHHGDPMTQFWVTMLAARRASASGSVTEAQKVLDVPALTVALPDHLGVLVLVERGLLACLAGDEPALVPLEEELRRLGAVAEAELLAGFRHDLLGDRKSAAAAFASAAEQASRLQPPVRSLALVSRAQLLDVLGQRDEALTLLHDAATRTELRRNGTPFLGWVRQGTPVEALLTALAATAPTPWVEELTRAAQQRPDIVIALAPVTPAPRERGQVGDDVVRPDLSPREREVLNELARGATYADIATSLFVSENTVKTHVSSLYGKLAVSRRSEALAVARNLHLL